MSHIIGPRGRMGGLLSSLAALAACGGASHGQAPAGHGGSDAASTPYDAGVAAKDAVAAPDVTTAVPASHCAIAASGVSSTVEAAIVGSNVSFMNGQGAARVVYTFPAAASGFERSEAQIASRGSYVAAALLDTTLSAPGFPGLSASPTVHFVLLDTTGSVLFSDTTQPQAGAMEEWGLVGNASGLFVLTVDTSMSDTNDDDTYVAEAFSPAGGHSWSASYNVSDFDPDAQGNVLVQDYKYDCFWLDTASHATHPATCGARWPLEASAVVYLDAPGDSLGVESAEDTTKYALMSPFDAGAGTLAVASSAPRAVLFDGARQSWVSRALASQANGATYSLTPPSGLTPEQGGYLTWGVDATGGFFETFNSSSGTTVARTSNGADWQVLGGPRLASNGFSVIESGGTYVAVWTDSAYMTLVARPASGVSLVLPNVGGGSLSLDGTCLAFYDSDGNARLADAQTGSTYATPFANQVSGAQVLPAVTLVPGDGASRVSGGIID